MIKLISAELQKLWGKRSFLGIIFVLLAVNVFLLWYSQDKSDVSEVDSSNIPNTAYLKLAEDIKNLDNNSRYDFVKSHHEQTLAINTHIEISLAQAMGDDDYLNYLLENAENEIPNYTDYTEVYASSSYLNYCDNINDELAFITEALTQFDEVSEHSKILETISTNAKRLSGVSIFGGNQREKESFSSRNILKTAEDFDKMTNTSISYEITRGFTVATGFLATDIIAILFMLLLSARLIYDEKEKGAFSLIKSTPRGRLSTISSKIITLAITMFAMTILLIGTNFLYSGAVFGMPSFSATIQSIPSFIRSTLPISIGEYIIVFFFSKYFAYFLVGILVLLIAIISNHPVISYLISGGIILLSFSLYTIIPATSNLNIFKYINLFSFIRTNGLYERYLNLNLFEKPFNLISVIWFAIIIVVLLLIILNALVFTKKKQLVVSQPFFNVLFNKIKLSKLLRFRAKSGIFGHEMYKFYIVNKGLLILFLLIVFQFYTNKDNVLYTNYDEPIYQHYIENLSGPLTSEKEEFIQAEQEKYDFAQEKLDEIYKLYLNGEITQFEMSTMSSQSSKTLTGSVAWSRIVEQYGYIKNSPNAEFVNDTGYSYLFNPSSSRDEKSALILVFVCIILFSGFYPLDEKTGASKLINTSPLGKSHTHWRKILVGFSAIPVIIIAVYLPTFLLVKEQLAQFNSPIRSFSQFEFFPSFVPIWGYLILLFALRILFAGMIMLMIFAISRMVKQEITTMLISGLLFAVPVILYFMRLEFIYKATVLNLLSVNHLLTEFGGGFVTLIFFSIGAVLSCVFVFGKASQKP